MKCFVKLVGGVTKDNNNNITNYYIKEIIIIDIIKELLLYEGTNK